MRLLNVHSLEFEEHHPPIPPYAIASHRWKRSTEASIEDVRTKSNTEQVGYKKVEDFAEYVRSRVTYVQWLWIDTCCIDQKSSQEVSEAINSMFEWYRNAEVCLAYLADVETTTNAEDFRRSEWFGRGWTLQELLAPRTVVFLSKDWRVIGHKGTGRGKSGIELDSGPSLDDDVVARTRIPNIVVKDFERSEDFDVGEKLEWIAGRETTRAEDMSYSLLGIFDIGMNVRYGEGKDKARKRLLSKIRKKAKAGKHRLTPSQLSDDVPFKPSSNVPFRRDPDFIDRDSLMGCMHEKLTIPAGRVALVGLGGVG